MISVQLQTFFFWDGKLRGDEEALGHANVKIQ